MPITTRRLLGLGALGAALIAASSAQAWNWGRGERISGNGDVTTEARDVGGFDGVALSGSFDVVIRQGAATRLEVKADRNLLPYLETRVVDGAKGRTLEIAPKRGYDLSGSTSPRITIELPALRAVALAGSGNVRAEGIKADGVDVSIAGSGDIRFMELSAESAAFKVSGSGSIYASGRARQVAVSIAGSGNVKLAGLAADEVKVNVAGSGDAQVQASKRLQVSIAGSGDVRYGGSPEISSSIAGSGTVRKLD